MLFILFQIDNKFKLASVFTDKELLELEVQFVGIGKFAELCDLILLLPPRAEKYKKDPPSDHDCLTLLSIETLLIPTADILEG